MAHHPRQAFQQRLVRRVLAAAELVQPAEVIGNFGLFASKVLVRFGQDDQVGGKQTVRVVALQFLAGEAGQRMDTVVQRSGSWR
ncbi:hypothetical protein [Actinacidiphila rubida]|uniref:hypothetical protein n=1 Tax=Actinacidiphila rubida TaxID=310780 RepID=UPI0009A0AF10|nr:hypothetical protein [Actinacidiphila rubida]